MIDIRATAPDEARAVAATVAAALLHPPPDDAAWAAAEPSWRASDSLSAWDDDRCVGHVAGYRVDTVVPGGARLPTAAVARVGVLATHRRRGLARRLMHRLLTEAAERGQVLASLRASEAVIYHRFGFGVAGEASEISFDPAAARPVRAAEAGTVRMLHAAELLDVVPGVYALAATRPGVISRPDFLWRRYLATALEPGGDAEYVAVHSGADGTDDGYVHYQIRWAEAPHSFASGSGEILDLWGTDPGVELALWAYLTDVDLVRSWTADTRPVDDPVRLAVADPRACRVTMGGYDEQWLRLLDVDAALGARTYGGTDRSITIAVHDDLLPANTGVWSIGSSGVNRIDARADVDAGRDLGAVRDLGPDLSTDVATLAAAYLGGVRWSALAAVGRVRARDAAALATADDLFLAPTAPFCGSFF